MGAGASASAEGSQRGGSSQAGDSEGEGDTTVGSTATKTTLPGTPIHAVTFFSLNLCFVSGQTKAAMKDMDNMRKLMLAKEEKERALTLENNDLKKRVGQLEEKLTQMFAALKLMKVQASENAKRLSDAEEQIVSIGAPEREVHVQRFAKEQLQVELEEFKAKVAEQQMRYERDIRLAHSNLTTRAGADGSTKESMREQLLSLRATVADLRATNSKLIVENAAQAAKLATIESGAPITDAEVGDFDSPFFRGAQRSQSKKSRDISGASQASSALPSAR
jgi:chromosome segregation ATPase